MRHIGLFEGIGGFSLAAQWMGWETIAWCEINSFCQTVLKYHFPDAQPHTDIRTTDFRLYRGQCELLTGGFPCQPYSVAGKRKGKEDERHLWPEMLRAIREIQPRYVVGENVGGLISWDGGLVFEEVHVDLGTEGYEVQAFVLPACAVDAPHRRDRVWFIAKNTNKNGWCGDQREKQPCEREQRNISAGNNERLCANCGETTTHRADTRIKSMRPEWENSVYEFGSAANTSGSGWIQNNQSSKSKQRTQSIPN